MFGDRASCQQLCEFNSFRAVGLCARPRYHLPISARRCLCYLLEVTEGYRLLEGIGFFHRFAVVE
jgi:hypothetical protein